MTLVTHHVNIFDMNQPSGLPDPLPLKAHEVAKKEIIKYMQIYMTNNNLKRYELAHKLGTTESNISNWLNGKHKVSRSWTQLIEQKLNIK